MSIPAHARRGSSTVPVEVTPEELRFLWAFRTGRPEYIQSAQVPAPGGRHFGQLIVEVGNALGRQGAAELDRDHVKGL